MTCSGVLRRRRRGAGAAHHRFVLPVVVDVALRLRIASSRPRRLSLLMTIVHGAAPVSVGAPSPRLPRPSRRWRGWSPRRCSCCVSLVSAGALGGPVRIAYGRRCPRIGGRGVHDAPAGARRGDDVDQDDDGLAAAAAPDPRSGEADLIGRPVGVPVRTLSPAANGGDQSSDLVGWGSSGVLVASASARRPPLSSGT